MKDLVTSPGLIIKVHSPAVRASDPIFPGGHGGGGKDDGGDGKDDKEVG